VDILNQYHVTENIASSGQPDEAQIEQIASEGYYAVINLAMPDHKKSLANEGSIVTSLGMTYIHIPVPFEAPNEDHLVTFSGYMDVLETKKVWVHCIVNARVSAFLFRYLQKNRGWSAQKSATPILKHWLPEMDVVWKDFICLAPERL
jgi:protein tyrosine phosphatase (PTP) superfamily phosphohydrolase (DUF442 family)